MRILGYNYKIVFSPPMLEGGMSEAGRCNTALQVIAIDPTQSEDAQNSTLIHEIIEAINYHLQLNLDHNVISSLESGLFQVLNDNEVFDELERIRNGD